MKPLAILPALTMQLAAQLTRASKGTRKGPRCSRRRRRVWSRASGADTSTVSRCYGVKAGKWQCQCATNTQAASSGCG